MESDKYVTLFSNICLDQYTNNFSKFRNKLIMPLKLEGDWKVSLLDISFPFNPINIPEQKIGFLAPVNKLVTLKESNDTSGIEVDDDDLYYESGSSPQASVLSVSSRTKYVHKYRYGTLKAGYYSSVGELTEEITNIFNRTFADLLETNELQVELCMDYDQCTNQAKVYTRILDNQQNTNAGNASNEEEILPIIMICENENLLKFILCFDNVKSVDGRHGIEFSLEVTSEDQLSASPCILKQFHKMYICSDVIDHQYVGNKALRLLTSCVIPTKGNYHMISPSPRYHSIVSGYDSVRNFDTIEIELFSNIQNLEYFQCPLNPSDNDLVECTLHFKRSSLIHSFPI